MAHSADTVDQNELNALSLESRDLLWVGGEIVLGCEVSLILGNGKLTERAEECIAHSVLEGCGIVCGKGITLAVAPFVHIEGINVVALYLPFLKEVNCPFIHSHRAYGKNECDLLVSVASGLDLKGNLVTHIGVKLTDVVATDGLKAVVPEGLSFLNLIFGVTASIDPCHIPACRVEALEH